MAKESYMALDDFQTLWDEKLKTVLAMKSELNAKADKSEMSVVDGTDTDADKTTIQLKNGTSATVLTAHQDLSGYKTTQPAVSDPSADGTGITFIDSITQNANGVITPHKKTVQNVVASNTSTGTVGNNGLMTAAMAEKLDAIAYAANSDIDEIFA